MNAPLSIDVPHSLPRAEVRRRLKSRIGELPGHIPGGFATVASDWPEEDRMRVTVSALGQDVETMLEIRDDAVRVSVMLPPALGFFRGLIEQTVRAKGAKLLT